MDAKIRSLPFVSGLKKLILIHFKTDENSIFDAHNPIGIRLLVRLRLNFSHLSQHRLFHNFWNTGNPFCLYNAENETTSHYLLRCPLFSEQRTKLINLELEILINLDNTLLNHCDDGIVNILLYGSSNYGFSTNKKMLLLLLLSF